MNNNVTIEQIEEYSCNALETNIEEVKAMNKASNVSEARRMIFYFIFRFTRMTTMEIAAHYDLRPQMPLKAFDIIRDKLSYDRDTKLIVRNFEEKYIN